MRRSGRVLITGAGGLIGEILLRSLPAAYDVIGVDKRRVRDARVRRVDMTNARAARAACEGADALVDLAGVPNLDTSWDVVWKNNIRATMNGFAAAQAAGVRRIVFASSNHVTGLYEAEQPYAAIVAGSYAGLRPQDIPRIDSSVPIRPDSAYAVGKAFGEAAGRYYAETFGLSVICLRIGTVNREDRPKDSRHYATWLSHGDLVRLVRCALEAPDPIRFGIYYGVSKNKWAFWDINATRTDIGYDPQDDAERFRAPIDAPL